MKNSLLVTILSILPFLIVAIGCNDRSMDKSFGTTILDTMSNEKLKSSTRTFIEEAQTQQQVVRFTVIYNGDLNEMSTRDNSPLKALLEKYYLDITDPFEIDDENKGIILVPRIQLVDPILVGKEISLLEEVLMVEVENATPTEEGVS